MNPLDIQTAALLATGYPLCCDDPCVKILKELRDKLKNNDDEHMFLAAILLAGGDGFDKLTEDQRKAKVSLVKKAIEKTSASK